MSHLYFQFKLLTVHSQQMMNQDCNHSITQIWDAYTRVSSGLSAPEPSIIHFRIQKVPWPTTRCRAPEDPLSLSRFAAQPGAMTWRVGWKKSRASDDGSCEYVSQWAQCVRSSPLPQSELEELTGFPSLPGLPRPKWFTENKVIRTDYIWQHYLYMIKK